MATPRIPTGRRKDLGIVNWLVCGVISKGARVPEAHLFTTLARTRGLFRGWLFYSSKLMPGGKISRHDSELVILRVAHLRECGYELDHHTRLGKRAGITSELRERIFTGPTADGLSDKHRVILTAVDELVATKNLGDGTWLSLSSHFDDRRLIEFVLLVAQYDGLATTIGTLRVERDFA